MSDIYLTLRHYADGELSNLSTLELEMTRTRIAEMARTLAPHGVEVGFMTVEVHGVEVG
ncbi:MAG: hypothetical protein ACT4NY_30845 [Pseudonocardiales bacterium]